MRKILQSLSFLVIVILLISCTGSSIKPEGKVEDVSTLPVVDDVAVLPISGSGLDNEDTEEDSSIEDYEIYNVTSVSIFIESENNCLDDIANLSLTYLRIEPEENFLVSGVYAWEYSILTRVTSFGKLLEFNYRTRAVCRNDTIKITISSKFDVADNLIKNIQNKTLYLSTENIKDSHISDGYYIDTNTRVKMKIEFSIEKCE